MAGTLESKVPMSLFVVDDALGGEGNFSIEVRSYDKNYPISDRSDIGVLMVCMGRSNDFDSVYGDISAWFWCTDTEALACGPDGEYDLSPTISIDPYGWVNNAYYQTYINVDVSRYVFPCDYIVISKSVFIPKALL